MHKSKGPLDLDKYLEGRNHKYMTVIRQIKCGLIPQIKNDFLRYAKVLQSELFAAISAHCFM